MTTHTEIATYWTINDLADAHEILDVRMEADAFYQEQAEQK